jgi:hypothetical protein
MNHILKSVRYLINVDSETLKSDIQGIFSCEKTDKRFIITGSEMILPANIFLNINSLNLYL